MRLVLSIIACIIFVDGVSAQVVVTRFQDPAPFTKLISSGFGILWILREKELWVLLESQDEVRHVETSKGNDWYVSTAGSSNGQLWIAGRKQVFRFSQAGQSATIRLPNRLIYNKGLISGVMPGPKPQIGFAFGGSYVRTSKARVLGLDHRFVRTDLKAAEHPAIYTWNERDARWRMVYLGRDVDRISQVSFRDASFGVGIGAISDLVITLNGGLSWKRIPLAAVLKESRLSIDFRNPDYIPRPLRVTFCRNDIYLLFSDGQIFRSVDDGRSWKQYSRLPDALRGGRVENILFDLNSVGLIDSRMGKYISLDAGTTWKPILTGIQVESFQLFKKAIFATDGIELVRYPFP